MGTRHEVQGGSEGESAQPRLSFGGKGAHAHAHTQENTKRVLCMGEIDLCSCFRLLQNPDAMILAVSFCCFYWARVETPFSTRRIEGSLTDATSSTLYVQ